jgi:hypothetical protein
MQSVVERQEIDVVGKDPSETVQVDPPSEVVTIPEPPPAKQTKVEGHEIALSPLTPGGGV